MKPESKKNRIKSTNKSEGSTASPSCYDLTALSQALDDQERVNKNKDKDKSSFDLSNLSEALNNVAKEGNRREIKRLEVLRSIARSQEEVKTRQMRARRQRMASEAVNVYVAEKEKEKERLETSRFVLEEGQNGGDKLVGVWLHGITVVGPGNLDSKWSMGYNPDMREYEPAYENATSLYSPEPEEIHVSTSPSLKNHQLPSPMISLS
ncbi:hypothetical protein POTOM_046376 [Populus tomentosa]|uniref:Uncharacterized protein n=1 Tax=Populus tomentosa TaxID=118781 RepID=A0A8X8CCM0_POPTO|nr:hypothetical protein POTOM_046376 [Populus tomentosa]